MSLIKVVKKFWHKHHLTCKCNVINLARLEKVKIVCAKEETFSVNNRSVYWITQHQVTSKRKLSTGRGRWAAQEHRVGIQKSEVRDQRTDGGEKSAPCGLKGQTQWLRLKEFGWSH
jgi:hypothetical protein